MLYSAEPCVLCVEGFLSSELHRHVRARSHMRPRWRGLLSRYAAANSFQLQACIFGGFHSSPHCFSHEGRHFDSTLFDIQHYSPCCGLFRWILSGLGRARDVGLLLACIGWHRFGLADRGLHHLSVTARSNGRALHSSLVRSLIG